MTSGVLLKIWTIWGAMGLRMIVVWLMNMLAIPILSMSWLKTCCLRPLLLLLLMMSGNLGADRFSRDVLLERLTPAMQYFRFALQVTSTFAVPQTGGYKPTVGTNIIITAI